MVEEMPCSHNEKEFEIWKKKSQVELLKMKIIISKVKNVLIAVVSLNLKSSLVGNMYWIFLFKILSDNIWLLFGVFSPFILSVIINTVGWGRLFCYFFLFISPFCHCYCSSSPPLLLFVLINYFVYSFFKKFMGYSCFMMLCYSALQQSESAICLHISPLFGISFPFKT